MIQSLNNCVVSIDTFPTQYKDELVITGEGILVVNPMTRRTSVEVRGILQANYAHSVVEEVSLVVSDIFRGRDNDYLVIGHNLKLDNGKPLSPTQKLYLRKMTGLTVEEERFLRLMRLKPVKTMEELTQIEIIHAKVEEYQLHRLSDYKQEMNRRKGIIWHMELF